MKKVLSSKTGSLLIFICCFTYAIAYFCRLSYAANITNIERELSVENSRLGLVSSFMFFAYAGGQLLHVFLSKYYNPKYCVTVALIVTAICNFLITLTLDTTLLDIIWLINGFAQSFMWCNVLNIQSENICEKQINKSVMWTGFSYCFGTFSIYAISAAFASVNWRITFYIGSCSAIVVSAIWFAFISHIEKCDRMEEPEPEIIPTEHKNNLFTPYFCIILGFALITALCNTFIRDGIITWLPTILKTEFDMSDSVAILITLAIATLSVFGAVTAKKLSEKIHGYLLIICICMITVFSLVLIAFFGYNLKILLMFALPFTVTVVAIYCVTNVITGKIPFGIRKYGNVGGLSSFLDAFCYLGSSLATFLFGLIADKYDWSVVLITVLSIAAFAAVTAFTGHMLAKRNSLTKSLF